MHRLPSFLGLALLLLSAGCDSGDPEGPPRDSIPPTPAIVSGTYSALTVQPFYVEDEVGLTFAAPGTYFNLALEFEPGATPRELGSIAVRDSSGDFLGGWTRDDLERLEGEGNRLVLPFLVGGTPSDIPWERLHAEIYLGSDTTSSFQFDLRNVFAEVVRSSDPVWVGTDSLSVELATYSVPPAPSDEGEVVWLSEDLRDEVARTPFDLSTVGGRAVLTGVPRGVGALYVRTAGVRDGVPIETASWPRLLPERLPEGLTFVDLPPLKVRQIATVPGGFVYLVRQGIGNRLFLLDAETGAEGPSYRTDASDLHVEFSPDGRTAWLLADGTIHRVDLSTGAGTAVGAAPMGTRQVLDGGTALLAVAGDRVTSLDPDDATPLASREIPWDGAQLVSSGYNPVAGRAYVADLRDLYAFGLDPQSGALTLADSLITQSIRSPRRLHYLLPDGSAWVDPHGIALRSTDGPDDLSSYGYFDVDDFYRVGSAHFAGSAETERVVALHLYVGPNSTEAQRVLGVYDLASTGLIRRLPIHERIEPISVTRVGGGYVVLATLDGRTVFVPYSDAVVG